MGAETVQRHAWTQNNPPPTSIFQENHLPETKSYTTGRVYSDPRSIMTAEHVYGACGTSKFTFQLLGIALSPIILADYAFV